MKARWTKTCSRTRPSASSSTSTRRDIAMPMPSTPHAPRRRPGRRVHGRTSPQFRTEGVTIAGRHRRARSRVARTAPYAPRRAVRRGDDPGGRVDARGAGPGGAGSRRCASSRWRCRPPETRRRSRWLSALPSPRGRARRSDHRHHRPAGGRRGLARRSGDLAHRSAVLPAAGRRRPRRHARSCC